MAPAPVRSLATRLVTRVLLLGAAIVLAGTVVSYRAASGALRERLLAQLAAEAEDGAEHLAEWLVRQRDAVIVETQFYAQFGEPVPARPDSLPLRALPRDLLAVDELQLIAVPGGRVLRSTNRRSVGAYTVDDLFYQQGRHGPFLQNLYYSGTTGRPRLTIAAPVRAPGDTSVQAIIAAHLDLTQMEAAIGRQFTTQRAAVAGLPVEAYLVNRDADFVSAQRFGRQGVHRGVHSRAIDDARRGGHGAGSYVNYAGVPVIGAWRWIPQLEVALLVEAPQDVAFAPARALLLKTLLLGLVATALLAFGVIVITRRFTRPVVLVADAAARLADGDFAVVAPDTGTDEAGRLGRAFNVMTGRLQALYASLADQVAATRTALAEASTSRELLQDLLDNTATLVLVVDPDARLRLVNARAAALSGVREADAVGKPLASLFGEASAPFVELLERVRERRTMIEQEVELDSAGEAHAWQVVGFPLTHGDGTTYAFGLIGTDLSERARAEAERRERDASVQQAQKLESLGVMAGGIAHDFNNILGAILGNAELAREALTAPVADTDEAVDALARIDSAGRRAAELTRQMLAYAGRASLRRDTVDLRQVIGDILPIVRASQSKKVRFELRPMPSPLWVRCDPSQLSQVVLNLLTNAAEAIGDAIGTVSLEAAPGAPASRAGETAWIRLTVSDTGAGIPESMRSRIFDPFFSTKESGRGLGLSAVRGIVRSLGGVLELSETASGGACFAIHLPGALAAEPSAPDSPPVHAPVSGTVLVVDDEALVRHLVVRVAARMGLTVLEAEDGDRGLAAFRADASRISAVVLDLTMPGMNGAELLAAIRREQPALPAIVMSGYDADDALATIGDAAAVTFVQKPFTPELLRQRIEGALRQPVG